MVAIDKDKVAEHKESATVVFDKSLQGKKIDAIDKKAGLDFEDQGRVTIPNTSQNLYVGSHKYTSAKFAKHYDEMEWMCDDCGKMHRKDVDCE